MLSEVLEQIGLTKNESRTYLELLSIGPQPVSVLARRINVNRTTLYSVLKSLQRKGLVSSLIKSGVRVFHACDPNNLIGYFDKKCQQYEYLRSSLLAKVEEFRRLSSDYDFVRPLVTFHDGPEAIKIALYDVLTSSQNFYAYFNPEKWMCSDFRTFLLGFSENDLDAGYSLKCITPDLEVNRRFFTLSKDILKRVLYISEADGGALFDTEMVISDDRVLIFKLDKGMEYAVVLQGKAIAQMHKAVFDVAYRSCEGEVIKI